MRYLTVLSALCLSCNPAHAQILHATGTRPSFEVATVKPWRRTPAPPPSPDGTSAPAKVTKVSPLEGSAKPTNRVHIIIPAASLIAAAYNLPAGSESRIVNGPDWLHQDIDQYEIQAKIDDVLYASMQKMSPAQQREQVMLMEQSLLAERFRLEVHFEMKEMPVYNLVISKGDPKLVPAKINEATGIFTVRDEQGLKMTATAVTLNQLVLSPLLTGPAGRLVVDQTGLTGVYDFTLTWEPNSSADAPSLYTALQEQLGLKLVPSKAPVEIIVIDHIERPSAN